jgi:hypothetical protein
MSSHITSRHPAIGSILSAHALTVHETLLGKYSRVDDCHVPEEIFDDQAVKQCNHPLILGFRIGTNTVSAKDDQASTVLLTSRVSIGHSFSDT